MRRNRPKGKISFVEMTLEDPPFATHRVEKGARGRGQRYEAAAQVELSRRFPGYVRGPWFRFYDGDDYEKWCQPDGLLVEPRRSHLTVVEIKLRHCQEAYDALFGVYLPVVFAAFKGFYKSIEAVEVCQWFDAATLTTQAPRLCEFVGRPHPSAFNVHIWRP